MNSVAVVGVGLIGGSLLRALSQRAAQLRLVGIDPEYRRAAQVLGGEVDQIVDSHDQAKVEGALAAAEVVVLSVPVRAIRQELPRALASGSTVTDCGSTKRGIVLAAEQCAGAERFVPGHPMAGFPEGGVEHADPDLFQGRRWILCPSASAPGAFQAVEQLVKTVGAEPVVMEAEAHDRAVALTSHVPQILASLLKTQASEFGAEVAAGPGFASATRVAGGSADIWQDIFTSNADEVAMALRRVGAELERLAVALGATPPDTDVVMALLDRARKARQGSTS